MRGEKLLFVWQNCTDRHIDGRIILRCTFRKWDVEVWTGSIWLRIGKGGGHL
jgi:hypothetical protein